MNACTNCQGPARPRARRCSPCAAYLRRHGIERPEALIVTAARAQFEQQAFISRIRRAVLVMETEEAG